MRKKIIINLTLKRRYFINDINLTEKKFLLDVLVLKRIKIRLIILLKIVLIFNMKYRSDSVRTVRKAIFRGQHSQTNHRVNALLVDNCLKVVWHIHRILFE